MSAFRRACAGGWWQAGPMPTPPYIQHSDGSIHEGQSVQPRDLPDIAVEERELTFIRVDHQVRFQFGETEVMIESPFTLLAQGQEYESDPEHREGLGPVLALYPDSLRTLVVDQDGTLRLDWESGAALTVPPDPRFEAWQVSGPGHRLIVCTPGGSLAVWL